MKLSFILLVFVVGASVGIEIMHDEYNKLKLVTTYYFPDPVVVDPKVNATSDLYVTGELKVGRCYETK